MRNDLELLAPAGDWERLEMALRYGADAVYLAGKEFGLRAAAGNFENDELIVPEKEENYKFENGELKLYVKPLSWNVYVFEA